MKTNVKLPLAKQEGKTLIFVAMCMLCVLLFMPKGCVNKSSIEDDENDCECWDEPANLTQFSEEDECNCKDGLFFYEAGDDESRKVFLGDLLLNDRLLIGFDENAKEAEIVDFVNQTCLFKSVNAGDIDSEPVIGLRDVYESIMFVVLREAQTCSQQKEIIQTLEKSPIVSYANLAYKGEKFTDRADIVRVGYVRVGSFPSNFFVKLKEANDLSDLYTLVQETNTKVLGQAGNPQYFILRADKYSKGNAMQMGNYFCETGKFINAGPGVICSDLKINP